MKLKSWKKKTTRFTDLGILFVDEAATPYLRLHNNI